VTEGHGNVSFWYGDPDDLDLLARRLAADAQQVRDAAAGAVRAAQAARWVSASAQRYRDVVAQDARRADDVADGLDNAAALLRAHADHVREIGASLARLEHTAADWFRRHIGEFSLSRAQAELVPGLAGKLRAASDGGPDGGAGGAGGAA
jgi:hypothetical protein